MTVESPVCDILGFQDLIQEDKSGSRDNFIKKIWGGFIGSGDNNVDIENDPLYDHAIEIVQDRGKASISMIQKKLRIGFNRAARFIEQMEMDGIIGPQEGSKPRQVIQDGENISTLGALVTI